MGVDAESMHRVFSSQELGGGTSDNVQKDDKNQAVSQKDDSTQNCLQFDRDTLINLQQSDERLQGIRDKLVPKKEMDKDRVCFYVKDGLIMRKRQGNLITSIRGIPQDNMILCIR